MDKFTQQVNTVQQLRDINTSKGDELGKILIALKESVAHDQVLFDQII